MPAPHAMQSVSALFPLPVAYFPATQSMQASVETVLYVPALQRAHEVPAVLASVSVYEPAVHAIHAAVPTAPLYCAAAHAVQVSLGVEMVPV